ncbi:hypothetical protein CN639_01260 [Bacillus toyonensis]|uniref:hypothetical protein n=1 Tax=Bacillus toyonensis TaxID=155322 RepID=UPI000BF0A3D9|nr:hypothetical protein [Bacillus toyonensis]PEM95199.1 hypothetical protein CN639_01260 [Bacillus toyonensis]PGB16520.1 hypothetical protein COL96_08230 [Bacillus toyonensis]
MTNITPGEASIVVAFLSSITAFVVMYFNNKKQQDRWYAEFFIKTKIEALNDFRVKSTTAVKNIEYFCSEKGRFELIKTLNLKEKDPNHQPPKQDYTLGYVTEDSRDNFIQLTTEKAKLLEESFLNLSKAYEIINVYFSVEEQVVLEKFIQTMKRYEHLISGNIKKFKSGNDIRLLEMFIHYSSTIYTNGYTEIKECETDVGEILVKQLCPDKVKKFEK